MGRALSVPFRVTLKKGVSQFEKTAHRANGKLGFASPGI